MDIFNTCIVASFSFFLLRIFSMFTHAVHLLYCIFIRRPHNLEQRYGLGTWVLITGAGGGIGGALCRELAQKYSFNMILVDYNETALQDVSTQILKINPTIKTKIVVMNLIDFGTSIESYKIFIREKTAGCDVSVLFNVAGVAEPGYFEDVDLSKNLSIAYVNTIPLMIFSHIFMSSFSERAQAGKAEWYR